MINLDSLQFVLSSDQKIPKDTLFIKDERGNLCDLNEVIVKKGGKLLRTRDEYTDANGKTLGFVSLSTRSKWRGKLYDPEGVETAGFNERTWLPGLLSHNLIPSEYELSRGGQVFARIRKSGLLGSKVRLDFRANSESNFDKRLGIAAAQALLEAAE